VATEDPLTPGEIRRAIERLELADRTLGDRLTQVASDMLPVKLWDAEHRALNEKLERHEKLAETTQKRIEDEVDGLHEEIKEIRDERDKHSEITWTKILGLITAVTALAGVIIGVVGLTKGIH
jgi:predicted  nucleic acid-binding Zn-ribbon protein